MSDPTPPGWTLQVARDDLSRTRRRALELAPLQPGEALLRVERVGLTANNVTYAVLGDSFRYWEFFPAPPGWGTVPVWGFAEVVASEADGVGVGARLYGYLPTASHLRVRPGRVDERGFRDASPHRATLPSPYNAYALTGADPAYDAAQEDLQVLFRPLYWTSFMLVDWLVDNDLLGARSVVLSSASSKTAYGAAFGLHRQGIEVVGLTSPRNTAFVRGLGCYDRVLTYAEVDRLPLDRPALYADLAGSPELTAALRAHLGDRLVHEVVVGVTNQEAAVAGTLADTGPAMFFAPDQMRKRIGDWGRPGLDRRFAESWRAFAPVAATWVDVVEGAGPEALERVWREVQAGTADPRAGHVVVL
ncbi:DUF2855 family protein [Geodermatophilus aquaeductus]|uniref:NADPH-dependent curcumin reductase CurA n=1 Tax=Geodermatophilus aquaeductus TaxID=1564161 RepID=A0A521C189_9ACTN|nr:DUF2855 family protein [Geodermatophilus aquaeductus]SMO52470.1 Protein of unknown function [Geodermatophilus aquaeductus]